MAIGILTLVLPVLARAETRALLVGVSGYPNLDSSQRLSAPKNDVREMRELLVRRGLRLGNVTVLADGVSGLPTRQNILDALATLTESSAPGDLAVVYFSGHGSFQPDQDDGPDRDEEDGIDEVFLPYDVEVSSPDAKNKVIRNGIIDDELGKFTRAIRAKNADLWFILDSCFSGTGLRASGRSHSKIVDPIDLGIEVSRSPSKKKPIGLPERDPSNGKPAPATHKGGGSAFFYASQNDEPSKEVLLPFGVSSKSGTWRSAFTHALVVALSRQPTQTYGQAAQAANRIMREIAGREVTQTADVDGDMLGRNVFGSAAAQGHADEWPLNGKRVAAGVLHGLEKGSIVALFDKPNVPGGREKGYAVVEEATPADSVISPIREFPCPTVNGNRQCRTGPTDVMIGAQYARLVAPPADYRIAVSSPRPAENVSSALTEIANTIHASLRTPGSGPQDLRDRIQFDDEAPDLIWWVTPKGFRLMPPGIDPRTIETGAAFDVSAAGQIADIRANAMRALLRAHRVERLRRSAAETSTATDEALEVSIEVSLKSYDPATNNCGQVTVAIRAAEPRARPCSRVQFNVKNSGPTARYVTMFMIDRDWNIVRFRQCSLGDSQGDTSVAGQLLAPGRERSCWLDYRGMPMQTTAANAPDFARNSLLVLSSPRREGMVGPDFDVVTSLNNLQAGARARSAGPENAFDDMLAGDNEGHKGMPVDKAPPNIVIREWDLDQRPR